MSIAATVAADPLASGQVTRKSTSIATSFEGFLQLLGAQLQHQDPLSPLDATQFTSQLVQFSTVEQAIRTNTQLEQLNDSTERGALTAALDFIGLDVSFTTNQLRLPQTGDATIAYDLADEAEQVSITIRDANGALVRQLEGSGVAGSREVAWDGLRSDGVRAPAGIYRVEIRANDADGVAVEARQRGTGRVEGIDAGSGGISLSIGGLPVPLEQVTTVSHPALS